MKSLIKRIMGVILFAFITFLIFLTIAKLSMKVKYKYLTYEGEWGVSNNCYEENGNLVCINNKELVKVMQFYYEE